MKIKSMQLISVGLFMTVSLVVGILLYKPASSVYRKEMPVFWGEEVVVKTGAKAISSVKIKEAVKIEKFVESVSQNSPLPGNAKPLPILPPRITFKVLPQFPASVLEEGRSGTVILSVFVNLAGNPEKIEVKSSSGIAELDKSAESAVAQWKFEPALQAGNPLPSWFEVPVRFEVK